MSFSKILTYYIVKQTFTTTTYFWSNRVHRVHLFNLVCTLYNKNPLDARKNGEKNEQINENTDIRRVVVPNTTLLAQ